MAKVKPKNEIAKKEETSLAMPAEMADLMGMGDGFENISAEDLTFPFLKIAQPTSAQCMEDDDSYIEGLKPGDFFNTVNNKRYGKKLKVIIIGYYQSILMWGDELGEYKGQISPQEFKAKKADLSYEENEDGKMEWVDSDGTKYVDTRTYFVMLPDHMDDGLMMFSLSSTGITHSKKWITQARMVQMKTKKGMKTAPLFTSIWSIQTKLNKKDSFRWYQIGEKKVTLVDRLGWVTPDLVEAVQGAVTFFKDLETERVNFAGVADAPVYQEEEDFDEDTIDGEVEEDNAEEVEEDDIPDFNDDF